MTLDNFFDPKPNTYGSKSSIEENLRYFEGDHFPYNTLPKPTDADQKLDLMRVFQQANVVRRCILHYASTLTSNPPRVSLIDTLGGKEVPPEDLEAMLAKIQAWINHQDKLRSSHILGQANPIFKAMVYRLVTGYGYLRVYQPLKFANSKDPYNRVAIHAPHPSSIQVERDEEDLVESITYTKPNGSREVQKLDYETGNLTIESYGIDGELKTSTANYGGSFTIFMMTGDPLLDQSIKSKQNNINADLTLKAINNRYAGFRERTFFNVEPPGTYEEDPITGIRIHKPGKLKVGAGVTNFVQGMPQAFDEDGNPAGRATPSATITDPVSISSFAESILLDLKLLYYEIGLGHLLTQGDGSLSGISRESLKEDSRIAIQMFASEIESAYGGALGVVHRRLNFDNPYSFHTEVDVEVKTAMGKPIPEERMANLASYQAGIQSKFTTMSNDGIENPQQEIDRIETEQLAQAELSVKLARIMTPVETDGTELGDTEPAQPAQDDQETLEEVSQDERQ